MDQIARITAMEQKLDEGAKAVAALSEALENYKSLQPALRELESYYTSPVWQKDYDDDAAGKILGELKRGVLSEDAVYDLLSENTRVLEMLRETAADQPDT